MSDMVKDYDMVKDGHIKIYVKVIYILGKGWQIFYLEDHFWSVQDPDKGWSMEAQFSS